jgi:hypothetical protein
MSGCFVYYYYLNLGGGAYPTKEVKEFGFHFASRDIRYCFTGIFVLQRI